VQRKPSFVLFKPAGIPAKSLQAITLTICEFEALRLNDLERIGQIATAKKMRLSQPTLQRILIEARKKIARALVEGKAIKIEGGNYKLIDI